ncbi:MAG: hypothetical protein CML22_00485 [Rheinheimera sp.]|nr:hypothetical protein [Rheinheimera sp.]MBM32764.1 hypothetical protein [Rheinheimera sp.]HAW93413.1 hypothetical protein [Candidatus Azambacteria bacterium]
MVAVALLFTKLTCSSNCCFCFDQPFLSTSIACI